DPEAADDLVGVAAAGDLRLGLGPLLERDALDRLELGGQRLVLVADAEDVHRNLLGRVHLRLDQIAGGRVLGPRGRRLAPALVGGLDLIPVLDVADLVLAEQLGALVLVLPALLDPHGGFPVDLGRAVEVEAGPVVLGLERVVATLAVVIVGVGVAVVGVVRVGVGLGRTSRRRGVVRVG